MVTLLSLQNARIFSFVRKEKQLMVFVKNVLMITPFSLNN